jgi:hypothetical protein
MGFEVMAERCNQCLYGPDKIVSNERRAEILREITRKDCHFVCHKASIAKRDVACRGDWDQRGCGQLGRIMDRLGAVQFISEAAITSHERDVPSDGNST